MYEIKFFTAMIYFMTIFILSFVFLGFLVGHIIQIIEKTPAFFHQPLAILGMLLAATIAFGGAGFMIHLPTLIGKWISYRRE